MRTSIRLLHGFLLIVASVSLGGSCSTAQSSNPDPTTISTAVVVEPTWIPPASTAVATHLEPESVSPISVALHRESLPRSDKWEQTLFIPYGTGVEEAGLSQGGDLGGVVFWGPDSAAPVDQDRWWVVDIANHRVALFQDGRLESSTTVAQEEWLRFGDVTEEGDFLANTQLGSVLIDLDTGKRSEAGDEVGHAHRVSGLVSEGGELNLATHCAGMDQRLILQAETEGSGAHARLQSGVEGFCSKDEVIHLLWYGYWAEEGQEAVAVASYVRIDAAGDVTSEAVGSLSSEHDPGSIARLNIVPGSNRAAITIIGTEGLEGWVRMS